MLHKCAWNKIKSLKSVINWVVFDGTQHEIKINLFINIEWVKPVSIFSWLFKFRKMNSSVVQPNVVIDSLIMYSFLHIPQSKNCLAICDKGWCCWLVTLSLVVARCGGVAVCVCVCQFSHSIVHLANCSCSFINFVWLILVSLMFPLKCRAIRLNMHT